MTLTVTPYRYGMDLQGLAADLPSGSDWPQGAIFYATDTEATYRNDGTTFNELVGGTGIAAWGQASTSEYSGSGSPVGSVTPDADGDLYVDTTTPALWQATGVADTDWQQVGAGGSLPSWFQSGSGSPIGTVVPTQQGAVYQDTTNGALYEALGTLDTDWAVVGGDGDPTATRGGVIEDGASVIALTPGGGQVTISDVPGLAGTGNALVWSAGSGDGDQQLLVTTGPSGEFGGVIQDQSGKMIPATTIDPSNFPTSDPADGGHSLWNDSGVIKVST